VGRAVEKSASLPVPLTQSNRAVTAARPTVIPTLSPSKNIFQNRRKIFTRQKSVVQTPRFTTQFTTTSPRFTITKHHKNTKTPCKNASSPQNKFSANSQPQKPSG
jgi:hypothetical protein